MQTPIPRQSRAGFEPSDPKPPPPDGRWAEVNRNLHAAWGDTDTRYPRTLVPTLRPPAQPLVLKAWRGERVSAQAVLWSAVERAELHVRIEGLPFATARFVRYVRSDDSLQPDILDDTDSVALPERTVRSVWVSVEPPPGTRPGRYEGTLIAQGSGMKAELPLLVEVSPRTLPPPREWSFYLDLWQNPYALARWHRVAPLSDEHLRLLRPHLRLLADAGQKVLTTTILHDPWGGQTFDPYSSMVEWTRARDGSWRFDFGAFDRYVAFGKSCGIGPFINCYSLIPWTNKLRFFDEASGEFKTLALEPGKPGYEEAIAPFLLEFARHLKRKGWFSQTRIAMDERPLPAMRAAFDVVKKHAPGLSIALAGEARPEFKDFIEDWCLAFVEVEPSLLAARRQLRKPTTYYVCCSPERPNTFTFSPPAEAHWMGLYAAARGYSGFLRWAFDSWTEDPFFDTKHVTWPAGDCFLVYPGARSSLRFERLREGIQDFEKIRMLHAQGADLREVRAALAALSIKRAQAEPVAPQVNAVRTALSRF